MEIFFWWRSKSDTNFKKNRVMCLCFFCLRLVLPLSVSLGLVVIFLLGGVLLFLCKWSLNKYKMLHVLRFCPSLPWCVGITILCHHIILCWGHSITSSLVTTHDLLFCSSRVQSYWFCRCFLSVLSPYRVRFLTHRFRCYIYSPILFFCVDSFLRVKWWHHFPCIVRHCLCSWSKNKQKSSNT
jgi:hypothetical protein